MGKAVKRSVKKRLFGRILLFAALFFTANRPLSVLGTYQQLTVSEMEALDKVVYDEYEVNISKGCSCICTLNKRKRHHFDKKK